MLFIRQHPHNNNPGTFIMPSRLFAADKHPQRRVRKVVPMSKSIGIVVSPPFPHLDKDRWVSKSELRHDVVVTAHDHRR